MGDEGDALQSQSMGAKAMAHCARDPPRAGPRGPQARRQSRRTARAGARPRRTAAVKVAYVVMSTPVPARSGYAVRIQTIAEVLDELSHLRLLVLGQAVDAAALEATRERFATDAVIAPPQTQLAKGLVHLGSALSNRQRWMAKFRADPLRSEAVARLKAFGPDVVILGHMAISSVVEPWGLDARRCVLDHHNVESLNYARMRRTHHGAGRLLAAVDERAFRALEARASRVHDHWAVSDTDRQSLEAILKVPVLTVPNVAQDSAFTIEPKGTAPGAPPVVGYMANYSYAPNEEAALELCAIAMEMRAAGSTVEAIAMGAGVTEAMRTAAARADVTLPGFVDDPRAMYERFSIVLAPIRSGAGTKLKIIEALAMGIPVVTTPIGAEGLPIEAEDVGIVAETNAELANACLGLLKDRARLSAMGARARTWARQNASTDTLRSILARRLQELSAALSTEDARAIVR